MSEVGWKEITHAAKNAYWKARREDKTENEALLAALDVAVGLATEQPE